MRNLKFRHFDKRLNDFLIFELLNVGIGWFSELESFDKDRADSPIEQFTGLKDVNGNEIYEGDIIKHNDRSIKACVVSLVHGCWMAVGNDGDRYFKIYWHLSQVEVIGNIHQHPELLEGDQ